MPDLPLDIPRRERRSTRLTPVEARQGTAEVDRGYGEEDACSEAERCFGCGQCAKCFACFETFFCPALYVEEDRVRIDEETCIGCGVCAQVCPNGAIVAVE